MAVLRIFLFGHVRVTHPKFPSSIKVAHSIQALMAYLLLQRDRCHPREQLVGLFWGDRHQDRARRCLNTALWRLRQVLEPDGISRGTYLLSSDNGEIGINPESDYWLDVASFEAQVAQILAKPVKSMEVIDVQILEEALQLYTGELLEGFYDDWALRERERLRRQYLNSLAHLMAYYQHHQAFEKSLVCGQKILAQDPLREEIHRAVMRLYFQNGQRARAVRQYQRCCHVLTTELGVPPMEETQLLHAQIVTASSRSQISAPQNNELINRHEAIRQLEQAVQIFDQAHTQLHQAIQILKQSVIDYQAEGRQLTE